MQTIKSALISLRMLLEFPNPKDPQDAEVAKMSLEQPERFARTAHEWAVKYAGAPRSEIDYAKYKKDDGKPKGSGIEWVPPFPFLPPLHSLSCPGPNAQTG